MQDHKIGNLIQALTFQCEHCSYCSNDNEDLQKHKLIHQAEIISNSLHMCPKCKNSIPVHQQKLQCDKCYYFFHKQCTDRRGKGGRLPKCWKCTSCNKSSLNPYATSFTFPQLTSNHPNLDLNKTQNLNKFPRVSGKHRQTGLCDHPDVEFLEMQVDTLKGSLAQKELEFTKLKQSDVLKAKQINNLESKLQEAMNTMKQKDKTVHANEGEAVKSREELIDNSKNISGENLKVLFLENKTSSIEHQLGLLSSKLDAFLISYITASKPTSTEANEIPEEDKKVEKYVYEQCPFECAEKTDIISHKEDKHEKSLFCKKCDFSTMKFEELIAHKKANHTVVIHSCEHCEYDTVHKNQLEKHLRVNHSIQFCCDSCTYKAHDEADLTNHKSAKHI